MRVSGKVAVLASLTFAIVASTYLLYFSMMHERQNTIFFRVTAEIAEQAYRIERGIGFSLPLKQGSRVEMSPRVGLFEEADCDIRINFPNERDPQTYPQVEVKWFGASSQSVYLGNFAVWVFYHGAPVDYAKYFDATNPPELVQRIAVRGSSSNDGKYSAWYFGILTDYQVEVEHIECAGFTISIFSTG